MAYKVIIDGLEVICDTPADVIALAEVSKPKVSTIVEPSKRARPNGNVVNTSLKEVIHELNEKAKEMLRVVLNAPDGISGEDLQSTLKLDGSALGGTRASFSKHFKSYGLEPSDYLEVVGGPGEKTYFILQDKQAEMRAALRV